MGKRSRLVLIKSCHPTGDENDSETTKEKEVDSTSKLKEVLNMMNTITLAADSTTCSPEDSSALPIPTDSKNSSVLTVQDIFSMPEIVENILKYLNKRDLLVCRRVKYIWNEEVCRVLRKTIAIRLVDRNLIHYERLLRGNAKLKLPLPFVEYKLSIRKLDDRNLVKILNSHPKPKIKSTTFIVSQTPTNSAYQKQLINLLERNFLTIESIFFNMLRGIYLGYVPLTDKSLPHLPALKTIGIHNKARSTIIPAESINFLLDVINSAPNLQDLELICDHEEVLIEIMSHGKFNSLESFYSEGLTTRQLETLSKTQIPKLKKLHLKYNDTTLQEENNQALTLETGGIIMENKFRKLVNNFASTLVELHISWIGINNNNIIRNDGMINNNNMNFRQYNGFPFCPLLKILTLYLYEGPLTVINSLSLPSLEQFNLVEYTEFQSSDSEHQTPHDGVISFSMEDFSGLYLDEEFEVLVNFVDRQFPKLQNLSIYMVLNDSSIRTIVTALPLLVKLQMRTGPLVTEEAFTGVPLGINIDEHLKGGKELKDIRVFPSLANMRYVKELDVSNFPTGPIITNVAIKYGLANMPSLEVLTMNWDSEYEENTIAESLGHLRSLRLSDWHHVNPSSSIFYLKKIMPQLHIPGYVD